MFVFEALYVVWGGVDKLLLGDRFYDPSKRRVGGRVMFDDFFEFVFPLINVTEYGSGAGNRDW